MTDQAKILTMLIEVASATEREVDIIEDTRQPGRYVVRGYGEDDIDGPLLGLATPDEVLEWCSEHERCHECASDRISIRWDREHGSPPVVYCAACGAMDGEYEAADLADLIRTAETLGGVRDGDLLAEYCRGRLLRCGWAKSGVMGYGRTPAGDAAVAAFAWSDEDNLVVAAKQQAIDTCNLAEASPSRESYLLGAMEHHVGWLLDHPCDRVGIEKARALLDEVHRRRDEFLGGLCTEETEVARG